LTPAKNYEHYSEHPSPQRKNNIYIYCSMMYIFQDKLQKGTKGQQGGSNVYRLYKGTKKGTRKIFSNAVSNYNVHFQIWIMTHYYFPVPNIQKLLHLLYFWTLSIILKHSNCINIPSPQTFISYYPEVTRIIPYWYHWLTVYIWLYQAKW
jgi:hypothetical protein